MTTTATDWNAGAAALAALAATDVAAYHAGREAFLAAAKADEDKLAYHLAAKALRDNPPAPVVGMLATFGIGSDSYAMVVTAVSPSGHMVSARHLRDGEAVGDDTVFTRRRNGRYLLKGATNYGGLSLGFANDYRDPSF